MEIIFQTVRYRIELKSRPNPSVNTLIVCKAAFSYTSQYSVLQCLLMLEYRLHWVNSVDENRATQNQRNVWISIVGWGLSTKS